MTPNQQTLDLIRAARELARTRDHDGYVLDELNKLTADYADWLSGEWAPTQDRAREHFVESIYCAIEFAREAELLDLSAALIALRPEIVGAEAQA